MSAVVAAEPTWWQQPFPTAPGAVERAPSPVATVRVHVLGEVRALVDGQPVDLGGLLPERVLLALALAAPRPAGLERLVDSIWLSPPPTAAKAVRVHIGRLRRVLGDEVIETSPGGYGLASTVHVDRLEYLERRGAARAAAVPADELRLLTSALAAWSGAELTRPSATAAVEEAQRALEQLLQEDEERHSDLLLAEGLDEQDLGLLRSRCDRHPFRERRWEQLIRALTNAGRPAEAIDAFRRCRTLFGDELGLPPGRAVQAAYDGAVAADLGTATFLECRAPLVGREPDLSRLDEALDRHTTVTVVGPPGIGKTQVCLELARRRRHRGEPTVTVEVPPRHRAPSVLRDLADDLGAVRADEDAALTAIIERLAGVSIAVIDGAHRNAEAVADLVDAVRAERPRLRLLITGRRPLGVDGEVHVALDPLTEPGRTTPWPETAGAIFAVRRGLVGLPEDDSALTAYQDATWAGGVPLWVEVAGRAPTDRSATRDGAATGIESVLDTIDPELVASLHKLLTLPVEASTRLLDDLGIPRARQRALLWHGLVHGAGPPLRLRAHDAVREAVLVEGRAAVDQVRDGVRRELIDRARLARPELGIPPDYERLAELTNDLSSLRWLLADPDDDLELVEHVADLLSLLGLGHEAEESLRAIASRGDPLGRARAALARARARAIPVADLGSDPVAGLHAAADEFRRRDDRAAGALLAALAALHRRAMRDLDAHRELARTATTLAPTPWLAELAELAIGVTELRTGAKRSALRRFAAAEATLSGIDRRGAALAAFLQGAHDAGGDTDALEHLERARVGAEAIGDRPLEASARLVTLQRLRARGHHPPAGVYGSIADQCDRAGLTPFANLARRLARADHD